MFRRTVKKKSKNSVNYVPSTPSKELGVEGNATVFRSKSTPKVRAFITKTVVPLVNNFVTDPDGFKAAGVAFTNSRHVLAGYQPHKKHPSISGIGGSRESGESYMHTALRECVEELFEPTHIPKALLSKLAEIAPQKVIQSKSYINAIYSFDDLQAMLIIMKRLGLRSPLYETFPRNLTELIMNRVPTGALSGAKAAEISHLALLPVVTQAAETFMDPYFVADMPAFM